LAAPVAEVVEADDAVPGAFVEVGDEGAYDGAAEVADVEFLGYVGAGEFDDDGFAVDGVISLGWRVLNWLFQADG